MTRDDYRDAHDAMEQRAADDLERAMDRLWAQQKVRQFVDTRPGVRGLSPRTPLFWPALGVLAFLAAVGFGIALLWGKT